MATPIEIKTNTSGVGTLDPGSAAAGAAASDLSSRQNAINGNGASSKPIDYAAEATYQAAQNAPDSAGAKNAAAVLANRQANAGNTTPIASPTYTLTSGPATADSNATADLIKQEQQNLQDTLNAQTAGINAQFDVTQRQLGQTQTEENATNSAVQFRLGREATPYAQSATEKLNQLHTDQMTQMAQQRQALISQANAAFQSGKIGLAKELIQNAKDVAKQQADAEQTKRENASRDIQDNLNKQTLQQNTAKNAEADLGKMATSGVDLYTFSSAQKTSFENDLGLNPGSFDAYYNQQVTAAKAQAAKDAYTQEKQDINQTAAEAAKYGAPASVLAAITGATTAAGAIQAATGYLQDPTSTGGQYNAYLKTVPAGKTPMAPAEFIAAQKYAEALAAQKAQSAYSYSDAYNAAAGRLAAENKFQSSTVGQQKLEKEYIASLSKELGARTGDLGVQNAKVSQAIHLKNLIDSNTITDAKGTKHYNITPQQQVELSIGVANLLAGGSTGASEKTIENITAATASGDFKKALQYATGVPQKGPSDEIVSSLLSTIDRQGAVAEDLRSQSLAQFRGTRPSGLSDERATEIEKIQDFPSFKHPEQNVVAVADQANNQLKTYMTSHPNEAKDIDTKQSAIAKTLGHQPSAVEFQEVYPQYFK